MAGIYGDLDVNYGTQPRKAIDYTTLRLPGVDPTTQAYGTGNPPGGLISAPNWLHDPREAVVRAMRMGGMNPASFTPFARATLKNADNLVSQMVNIGAAGNPQGGMADFSNNDAMLASLADLIKQGGTGTAVLGGGDAAALQRISAQAHRADAGTMNPGVNVLAEYLSDPNRAMNLTSSVLYGGLHPGFQAAAQAPLINLSDYYARLLETQPNEPRNIIDVLTGVYGGQGRTPFWFNPPEWR